MDRREKAAKDHLVAGLSTINGHCRGLRELQIARVRASCTDDELRIWSNMSRDTGRMLIELGARLAAKSASGMEDEAATSAARYLGGKGGRIGGKKGGKSRMNALTVEQRRELGRKAAAARWKKAKEK